MSSGRRDPLVPPSNGTQQQKRNGSLQVEICLLVRSSGCHLQRKKTRSPHRRRPKRCDTLSGLMEEEFHQYREYAGFDQHADARGYRLLRSTALLYQITTNVYVPLASCVARPIRSRPRRKAILMKPCGMNHGHVGVLTRHVQVRRSLAATRLQTMESVRWKAPVGKQETINGNRAVESVGWKAGDDQWKSCGGSILAYSWSPPWSARAGAVPRVLGAQAD
jgi:hypothetical protein